MTNHLDLIYLQLILVYFLQFLSSLLKFYSHEIYKGVCPKVVVAALYRSLVQGPAGVSGWVYYPDNPELSAFF